MKLENLPKAYKAVAAFIALVIPFLTVVGTSFADGVVTGNEWVAIATAGAAVVGGTKAVYQVENKEV